MVKLGDFPVKDEIYPTTVQTTDNYRIVSRFSEISRFLYHLRFEFALLLLTFLAIIFFNVQNSKLDIVVMLCLGVAALTSSIGGFAFSAIGGAILFHLSGDLIRMVQIMMICSVANQLSMVWRIRREIKLTDLKPFLLSGILGVGVGVELLLLVDHATFTQFIGGFLVLYSIYMIFQRKVLVRFQHRTIDFAVGFLSGAAGGVAGFPGAFVVPWAALKGWDKQRQRCLFQPFILIMQILALITISISARLQNSDVSFDVTNLFFVPFSLLCTSVGMRLYGALSDRQFKMAVNILLLISGIAYLI